VGLVVDTSALVDVEREEIDLDRAVTELGDPPVVMPAIVLAELLAGVRLARGRRAAAARQARVTALRGRVPVVEFGESQADRWAELIVELRGRGDLIPANDLVVAATALSLGWGVLVGRRDEAHFRRVPALDVHVLAA
jgi:tRNA(fMet)-specific endonuclease VapC